MPPKKKTEIEYQPSYLTAGIAALLVFLLYLATLAPSTAMWDTSEYISAAYVLGIPHPPGNPFFVLIGRFFSMLPISSTVAVRINILAALCSALSAGAWFLITERVLIGWLPSKWQRMVGASITVLVGGTAFTVWNQSVVNEKVYTVSLLFFAIVSWLIVRWCDDPDGPKANRLIVLSAYLLGLGYANHPAGFLVGPAVVVAIFARRPAIVLNWKLVAMSVGALVLGLTMFIYEPIRAAHFPAINEGEPTACTKTFEIGCTLNHVTYERLAANINREQYGKPDVTDRQAPFSAQIGMYWLYFKWQWIRDPHGDHPRIQVALATVFLILGLFGGYAHWRYDRRSFWFFGPLIFTVTFALIYYMNFKYGYSQAPDLGDTVAREVRDRDYFYLWSFSAWAVWVALGLVFVWESLAALVGTEATGGKASTAGDRPTKRAWTYTSVILVFAFIPLFTNWKAASRAHETDTRDFAKDLLNSVEPYGVLVTVGDNDTFPLWYAQEVEGIRKDVVVANTSLLNTDWYTRQMIRRPVFDYDSLAGPAVYRGHSWTKPTTPIMRMSLAEADAVPLMVQIDGPKTLRKPGTNFVATIDPRYLAHGVLERADIFVLHLIADNPDRPVYLSATAGNYGRQLGLQDYLLTQGLARKVLDFIPQATPDTIQLGGEGWFDVKRSWSLWQTFEAPKSIVRRGEWIDKPSANIPALYVMQGYFLTQALLETGDAKDAASVQQSSSAIADVANLQDLFHFAPTPTPAVPLAESSDKSPAQPVKPSSPKKK